MRINKRKENEEYQKSHNEAEEPNEEKARKKAFSEGSEKVRYAHQRKEVRFLINIFHIICRLFIRNREAIFGRPGY